MTDAAICFAAVRALWQQLQALPGQGFSYSGESAAYRAKVAEIRAVVDARALVVGRDMTVIALRDRGRSDRAHGPRQGRTLRAENAALRAEIAALKARPC